MMVLSIVLVTDKYGFRINTSGQKGIFSYGENFYYTKSDRKILNGNPWSDFIGMPPTIPVYDDHMPEDTDMAM